jgi:hypothetical protein
MNERVGIVVIVDAMKAAAFVAPLCTRPKLRRSSRCELLAIVACSHNIFDLETRRRTMRCGAQRAVR